jgi:hypothetical protein
MPTKSSTKAMEIRRAEAFAKWELLDELFAAQVITFERYAIERLILVTRYPLDSLFETV